MGIGWLSPTGSSFNVSPEDRHLVDNLMQWGGFESEKAAIDYLEAEKQLPLDTLMNWGNFATEAEALAWVDSQDNSES